MFFKKDILLIYCGFAGEQQCESVASINLYSTFIIEITLSRGFSPIIAWDCLCVLKYSDKSEVHFSGEVAF